MIFFFFLLCFWALPYRCFFLTLSKGVVSPFFMHGLSLASSPCVVAVLWWLLVLVFSFPFFSIIFSILLWACFVRNLVLLWYPVLLWTNKLALELRWHVHIVASMSTMICVTLVIWFHCYYMIECLLWICLWNFCAYSFVYVINQLKVYFVITFYLWVCFYFANFHRLCHLMLLVYYFLL